MVEDGNNYFTRKVFRKKKVVPGKVTPSFSEQQPPIPMISPPPYYTNNAVVRKKIIKPYVIMHAKLLIHSNKFSLLTDNNIKYLMN